MNKHFVKSWVAAVSAAAILMVGSMPASANEAKVGAFTDSSRLVSIGGSLTEIIYALGEEGRLVARDTTANFPSEATTLPDIGYMRALAPEGVLSVSPTALLVIEGSGPPEVLEVLSQSGVPYQTVPEGFSQESVLEKVRVVGSALGVSKKADELISQINAELEAAAELTKDIAERKRVLFILSVQGGKILASGGDTAASGIISLAGAENAVTGFTGYKPLTREAIIAANPDVILMMDRGGDHASVDTDLWADPAISLTVAGMHRKIIRMDGSYLLGFGPRTGAAVRELATSLYGASVLEH